MVANGIDNDLLMRMPLSRSAIIVTQYPGRTTSNDRVGWNILCNDRISTNDAVFPNSDIRHYQSSKAKKAPVSDLDKRIFVEYPVSDLYRVIHVEVGMRYIHHSAMSCNRNIISNTES